MSHSPTLSSITTSDSSPHSHSTASPALSVEDFRLDGDFYDDDEDEEEESDDYDEWDDDYGYGQDEEEDGDFYLYFEDREEDEDDLEHDLLADTRHFTDILAHQMGTPSFILGRDDLGEGDDDDDDDDDDDGHPFDPLKEFAQDDPIWKYLGNDAWKRLQSQDIEEAEYEFIMKKLEQDIAKLASE